MTSTIPSRYTVMVKEFTGTVRDSHGNTTAAYADPRPWNVQMIAPGDMVEPGVVGREELSRIAYTINADIDSYPPSQRDQVQVDGEWFEVAELPSDWTRGPWVNPAAGVTVKIARVEG